APVGANQLVDQGSSAVAEQWIEFRSLAIGTLVCLDYWRDAASLSRNEDFPYIHPQLAQRLFHVGKQEPEGLTRTVDYPEPVADEIRNEQDVKVVQLRSIFLACQDVVRRSADQTHAAMPETN